MTVTRKTGLILIISGVAIAIGGGLWNIYDLLWALASFENLGVDPLGDSILWNALYFFAGGLTIALVGAILVIVGRSRR